MPCIYKYNRKIPPIINFETKTLSADGKVENYSYSRERDLIGRSNYVLIVQGNALRYIDTIENYNTLESYTIVKKGSNGKDKIIDTILHIANIASTIKSNGETFDGTYKSCPDKATINFDNETGLRTLTFI